MKVLIADDESIIRMGLKSMLQEMGHVVIAARDGKEALNLAHANMPDLAILDIQMPKTNGLQTARALNRLRPLPIIFLTAYGQDELIERATDLPVQGYLIKPIKSAELKAALQVATKRFKEQQEEIERRRIAEDRLEARRIVDRAKGKLMESGLSETEAHNHIRRLARDSRQTMRQIAEAIIANSTS